MMGVAGLDPSLSATGLALPDGTLRTIKYPGMPPQDLAGRTHRIRTLIGMVGVELGRVPLLVAIEGAALGMSNAQTHQLAGLWWAYAIRLTEIGHRVVVVNPAQLKKLATGKGNAKKPDMRVAMLQRTGLDVADDNQVDAWWLRQAGLHLTGSPDAVPLPKAHLEVLAKVEVPDA